MYTTGMPIMDKPIEIIKNVIGGHWFKSSTAHHIAASVLGAVINYWED